MRTTLIRSFMAALIAATALVASDPPAKRAITLDDLQVSPDGKWVAYTVSTIDAEKDKRDRDLWMTGWDGGTHVRLTSSPGAESTPRWSPDNRYLAFLASRGDEEAKKKGDQVWLLDRIGGEAQKLTDVKGEVSDYAWSPDAKRLVLVVSDVDPADEPEKLEGWKRKTEPPVVIDRYQFKHDVEGCLKRLYSHLWLFDVASRKAEQLTKAPFDDSDPAWSPDGTVVNGLITLPASHKAGERCPMLLMIHGGPDGQDDYSFDFERELFAANGYAVLAVNYRGSSGRGSVFQKAIFADWGDKEVMDLLGAVDQAIASGVADPERLGIGGWSYGGMLTDYTIATDTRFKAAVSGAGSALQLAMYGHDEYIFQYEQELGAPWKRPDLWIKVSYPFFHADRIKTPTLFIGGESDSNVPILGGEQMYQALKSLNVETQLVVYPGQFHRLTKPSYVRDRLERFLGWYDKHLKTK